MLRINLGFSEDLLCIPCQSMRGNIHSQSLHFIDPSVSDPQIQVISELTACLLILKMVLKRYSCSAANTFQLWQCIVLSDISVIFETSVA